MTEEQIRNLTEIADKLDEFARLLRGLAAPAEPEQDELFVLPPKPEPEPEPPPAPPARYTTTQLAKLAGTTPYRLNCFLFKRNYIFLRGKIYRPHRRLVEKGYVVTRHCKVINWTEEGVRFVTGLLARARKE